MESQNHASAPVPAPSRAELIQKYHQQLLSGIERIKAHLASPEMPPEKIAFLTKKQAELEGQLLLFRNKYIDSSVRSEANPGNDLISNNYFSPAASQSTQPPPPSQSTAQPSSQTINQLPFSQSVPPLQLAHPMQQQGHPLQGTIPLATAQFSQGFSFPASSTSTRQISPSSSMMASQVSAGSPPLTTVSPQGFSSQFFPAPGQFSYLQQQFNSSAVHPQVAPSPSIHGHAGQPPGFHPQANHSFGLFSQTVQPPPLHHQVMNSSPAVMHPQGVNSSLFSMNAPLRMQQAPGTTSYYNSAPPSAPSPHYFYQHLPQQFSPMVQYRAPQQQQFQQQQSYQQQLHQHQHQQPPSYSALHSPNSSSMMMTPSGLSSPPNTSGVPSTSAMMVDYPITGRSPDSNFVFPSFPSQQHFLQGAHQQFSSQKLPLPSNFSSDPMIRKSISPRATSPSPIPANASPATPLVSSRSPISIPSESSVSPSTSIRRSTLIGKAGKRISQVADELFHSACGLPATKWLSAYDSILLDAGATERSVFSYLQFLVLNCVLAAKFSGRDSISVEDAVIAISTIGAPTSSPILESPLSSEPRRRTALPPFPLDVRTFPIRQVQRRSALLAHRLVPSLYCNTLLLPGVPKRPNTHGIQQRLLKKAALSSQESSSNTMLAEDPSLTDPSND